MKLTRWPGIERAPAAFIKELVSGAQKRGWDADALLGHISSESGFRADIRNPIPGQSATGLIQVIDQTARGLGFKNAAEVGRLSHLEQLRRVIWPYYERGGGGKKLQGADFKLLGFSANPALIGAPDDFVLYDNPKVLEVNPGADFDGDGKITAGDVRARWQIYKSQYPTVTYEHLVRSNTKRAPPTTKKVRSGGGGGFVIVLLAMGIGGIYWAKKSGKFASKSVVPVDIPS